VTLSTFSRRRAILKALALVVTLGGVAPVGVSAQEESAPALADAPLADRPPLSAIGQQDVLFTASDRDWTREEFEAATRFVPPPSLRIINELEVPFDRYLPSQIEAAIRETVTNLAAGAAARERGLQVPDPDELERGSNDVAVRIWLRRNGVMEASRINDADVEAFREQHRDKLMLEETLKLRHMFFPTYEEVTVEEGDTLESLSERINGDRAKASHILRADTRENRAGKDSHVTGKTEPDEPLQAGEVLLVPMGEEKAAEVEALAREGYQRVMNGEDFVEVAKEMTGNPNAASLITVKPATDEKPMLLELRTAFDSVGDGGFAEPVRTRHGFQIVMRESYQPHRLMTLDEVRARHLMDIRQDKAVAAYMKALEKLWAESNVVAVDEQVLATIGTDEADPEALILEVDGRRLTVDQFMNLHGEELDELNTVEARRQRLIDKYRPLQEAVMMWDIERLGIRDTQDYKLGVELLEATLLTPVIINELIEERLEEPTEQELRERFERDADNLSQVPSAYVWRITVTADTEAQPGTEEYRNAARAKLQELSRMMAEVHNVEEFEKLAREYSEDEFASVGGRVGRVNSYQEEGYYKQVIDRMNGRGVVGPIVNGRELQGYWVEEVFDSSETAFNDVKHILRYNELSERRLRLGRLAEREFLESANLQVMFDSGEEEKKGEETE
jgi:parvulin-like peptidyl-prolyl isomerase